MPNIESIALDWESLQVELLKLGVSKDLAQENFFLIDEYLKEHVSGGNRVVEILEPEAETTRDMEAVHLNIADEELPGYTPGPKPGTIEEKVQSLEQTTMVMNHSDPEAAMATSSKSPPAYTFEEGQDETQDEDFARYIREAICNEASRRKLERSENPNIGPQPHFWLPKSIQLQYHGREDIITLLEPNSFTAMAYETAPKCTEEIERLMTLLRVSFEQKNLSRADVVVVEASGALDSMSKAISKFMLLQDQHKSADTFSDLDALEFEYSTASCLEPQPDFPAKEFELCQKGYYQLLTYIMGLLEVFSHIFQGRTYITRSRHELEWLWKEKKMNIRMAWVEKQLAGWDDMEQAVLFCRDWRRRHPSVQDEALQALKSWQQAERILSGSEYDDSFDITVISASGLPKSTFGRPTAFVKLTFYIASKLGGQMRAREEKTEVASKSQEPVWNKNFPITLAKTSSWKNLDVDVYDRVAGMENHIGRARLPFSLIPGVEANLANRSLIYGLDGMKSSLKAL